MTAVETQPYSRSTDKALEATVDCVVTGARFTKRKSEAVLDQDICPQKPSGPSATVPSSSGCASGSSTKRIGTDHGDKQRRFEPSKTIWTFPHVQGLTANPTDNKVDIATSASGAGSSVAQTSSAGMDAPIYQPIVEKQPCSISLLLDDAAPETEFDPLFVEEDALVQRIRELSSASDLQRTEPDEKLDHTLQHQERLRMARAGKRVDDRRYRPIATALPNEIVIQVLEYLQDDQSALLNVASVCLDWNLCATAILYRNPKFASTLHWALFIQTLCRSKESTRPRARRRPSLIQNLSLLRQSSRHAPSQLAAAQIEVFGGRAQWNVSRLSYNLGEFVRHIDLSRKGATVDNQCTCAKQLASDSPQGGCSVHPETPTVGRVDSMHPANHIAIGTSQADQGTSLLVGDDASDTEADAVARAAHTPRLFWRWDRFAPADEPSSTTTTTFNNNGTSDRWTHNTPAAGLTVRSDSANGTNWSIIRPLERASGGWRVHEQLSHSRHASRSSSGRILSPTSTQLTPTSMACSQPGSLRLLQTGASPGHVSANRTRQETPAASHFGGLKISWSGELTGPESPAVVQRAETSDPRYKKPITITVSSLIQMAQYCSKLELLCLGSTILTPDTLFLETGDYQSTLQPGPRAGLTFVPVAIADVAKALGQYCPLLRKLWLPGCEWLTVDELQVFLSHCLGLEVLDLRHCGKLDGRLSQLFVLKNMDGLLQGGKDTKHSESDDSDDDSSKDRRREIDLAMFRTGGDRLDAQRQETVERMITTSRGMRIFPRVRAGTRETNTRGGAMFDVVNAASAGRLSLPSGFDPPLWPQTELQQPRSEQESQQARWEVRLQQHFQQQQHQPEQQPLHRPPQLHLQRSAQHAVDAFLRRPATYRYPSDDDFCDFDLLLEQQQQQQQDHTPQRAMRSAFAADSINRHPLADNLCALELRQSLDHPRNEMETQTDTEHAIGGQGGSSSHHGCDSEDNSATAADIDDEDDQNYYF